MPLRTWLLASFGLCTLIIGMGLIGYFILDAGSITGLLVGSSLTVFSVLALRRMGPEPPDDSEHEPEPAPGARLSAPERDRFEAFGLMSLNDVRARAEEFEAAQREFDEWRHTRAERRAHALDPDEQEGYAPEVQNGDRAKRWRALETELRSRNLWEVRELPEAERLRWAKRLVALSELLSRPERRWLGPKPPQPERYELP
jgi:hypothetical protein